jgi:hypothetical protein
VVIYRGDMEVAHHPLVAPGEVSISDDHYGKPAAKPRRAIRVKRNSERAFISLGEAAEDFLRAAAAAGTQRLANRAPRHRDARSVVGARGADRGARASDGCSGASRLPTSARSSRPGPLPRSWDPARCSMSPLPRVRSVRSMSTRWNGCRECAGRHRQEPSPGGRGSRRGERRPEGAIRQRGGADRVPLSGPRRQLGRCERKAGTSRTSSPASRRRRARAAP